MVFCVGTKVTASDQNSTPILIMQACALYHRVTVLDLILPRILAGESITTENIAALGHGGLCLDCEDCMFPGCGFGKGI